MLAIILTYYSCPEFLKYQLYNFKQFVKCDYKVFVIDNSPNGLLLDTSEVNYIYVQNRMDGPSARHQYAINVGIAHAALECESFLIMDNDMIFLEDFNEPEQTTYLPQKRGQIEYMWLNLLYLKSIEDVEPFDFYEEDGIRTDSGGNTCLYLKKHKSECEIIEDLTKQKHNLFPDYYNDFKKLCNEYGVIEWVEGQYDILKMNKTKVFHARQMSNWKKDSEDFVRKKKELLENFFSKLRETHYS